MVRGSEVVCEIGSAVMPTVRGTKHEPCAACGPNHMTPPCPFGSPLRAGILK